MSAPTASPAGSPAGERAATGADRSGTVPAHSGGLGRRISVGLVTPGGAVFVLVALLLVAIMLTNPNFTDPGALIRFVGRTAPIAIAAMGQFYVIVSGEFDLSMAAVIATQVVIAGNVIGLEDSRILPGLLLMFVVGTAIGLVNGLASTLLRVPSFIVTLGMMLALTGLVRYVTGGAATGNPTETFRDIGRGGIEGVPVLEILPWSVVVLAVVAAASAWLMRRPFGRTLVAAGDNPDALSHAGASLWWVKTRAFVLSSLSATVAGILLVGYAGVHPSVGAGYEFTAITAVVLGGVVLGGGRGWVLSAAAGAFALELLFLLLTALGVEATWRDTVQGLIIIAAVALAARTWSGVRRPRASSPVVTATPPATPENPTKSTTEGDR
ncbi:ABC transporter permease [Nocardioides sp. CFH 31398]|uniref:ABC transporter permease n=1 Tax=Nocardioides sp. CFH 31398 TaxID=2919579 RepID=UPI001F06DB04|nr:ABC transporter permease [Nocardioides sp. CFH 31398]MCH1868105.1 ABC transporter permease [Nocardioides sp. CFH 31398]